MSVFWIFSEKLGKRNEYLNAIPTYINLFDPENSTVN